MSAQELKITKQTAEMAAAICSSSIVAAVLSTGLDSRIRNAFKSAFKAEDEVLSVFMSHLLSDIIKLLGEDTGKLNLYRSEIAAGMHHKVAKLWFDITGQFDTMMESFGDGPVSLDDISGEVLEEIHQNIRSAHDMEKVATFLDQDVKQKLRSVAGAIEQKKMMEGFKDNVLAQKLAPAKLGEDDNSDGGLNGLH